MSIRAHHIFEHYDRVTDTTHIFPLPFEPDGEPDHVYISPDGRGAVLGFLVRDDSPEDPFEAFDKGEFFQFDRGRAHDTTRPDLEEWKRIIRANPGRVVSVDSMRDAFSAGRLMTTKDCRGARRSNGETCPAADVLEEMAGYYIAPDDVTDAEEYAEGAVETYSVWVEGDVYGVIIWTYERADAGDDWADPDRDAECWGFYGSDYAADELKGQFDSAVKSITEG